MAKAKEAAKTGGPHLCPHLNRKVPEWTRIELWVRAGGRCEFRGCNRFLLEDSVTQRPGNFAEFAHVVAFREGGPRGLDGARPADVHDITNLVLLCQEHHKAVDDAPSKYPRAELEQQKQEHEDRIRHLTGLDRHVRTTVLQVTARIADQPVRIPRPLVLDALEGNRRFPCREAEHIDVGQFDVDGQGFWGPAADHIKRRLESLHASLNNGNGPDHLSVFALAPIPLLVVLGRHLSSTIRTDLFQYHRSVSGSVDAGDWRWREDGPGVQYVTTRLRDGHTDKVALVLSLSGAINIAALPDLDGHTVYEMTLVGRPPGTDFLQRAQDLEAFCAEYRRFLAEMQAQHPRAAELRLFPAVPAPVAVCCGRERLPKVHPALLVHDANKARGGFPLALKVE